MSHGDDNGPVLPPRVAPKQVAIVPIWRGSDPRERILEAAEKVSDALKAQGLTVALDGRDNMTPGAKFHEWELLGVPLRLELGPKDLEKQSVVCVKRPNREKCFVPMAEIETRVPELLEEIQREMLETARERTARHTTPVDTYDEFKEKLEEPGGFLLAHWGGDAETEALIKQETGATIRCIALDAPEEPERPCIRGKGTSTRRVHFARAY